MNEHHQTLRFHLISGAQRAFLVARDEAGRSFTFEMRLTSPGFWFADVSLAEGAYHTRYYCGDERDMIYHGPAHANRSWQDGLDAVVVVCRHRPINHMAMTDCDPYDSAAQVRHDIFAISAPEPFLRWSNPDPDRSLSNTMP